MSVMLSRLARGLARTRARFLNGLVRLLPGGKLDQDKLDELEALFLEADLGVDVTEELLEALNEAVRGRQNPTQKELLEVLKQKLLEILGPPPTEPAVVAPHVVLVVGVNGTGKTTSIGKLAYRYNQRGHKVLIAAGDTFRAAAIEQLEIWAQRAGVAIIRNPRSRDPAAVVYDALEAARARQSEVVLVDTAGRLHTQEPLMEELSKIRQVIERQLAREPAETLLTIDATTGHNGLIQAERFSQRAPVTGLFLTKLDGTAKGGIAVAIARRLKIPVRYVGYGEQLEDMDLFDPRRFVDALLEE